MVDFFPATFHLGQREKKILFSLCPGALTYSLLPLNGLFVEWRREPPVSARVLTYVALSNVSTRALFDIRSRLTMCTESLHSVYAYRRRICELRLAKIC